MSREFPPTDPNDQIRAESIPAAPGWFVQWRIQPPDADAITLTYPIAIWTRWTRPGGMSEWRPMAADGSMGLSDERDLDHALHIRYKDQVEYIGYSTDVWAEE